MNDTVTIGMHLKFYYMFKDGLNIWNEIKIKKIVEENAVKPYNSNNITELAQNFHTCIHPKIYYGG